MSKHTVVHEIYRESNAIIISNDCIDDITIVNIHITVVKYIVVNGISCLTAYPCLRNKDNIINIISPTKTYISINQEATSIITCINNSPIVNSDTVSDLEFSRMGKITEIIKGYEGGTRPIEYGQIVICDNITTNIDK